MRIDPESEVYGIKNLVDMCRDDAFLVRLLACSSTDEAHQMILGKQVDITLDNVQKIAMMVCDLEKNEGQIKGEDRELIKNIGCTGERQCTFDEKICDFVYNARQKYPPNFFLTKEYYDGETVSKGLFVFACRVFNLKKQYLRRSGIWNVDIYKN